MPTRRIPGRRRHPGIVAFRGRSQSDVGDLMERFRSVDDVVADDALIETLQRDGSAVMVGWSERYSGPIAAVLARRSDQDSVSETAVHERLEELRSRRAELRTGVDPSPLLLSLTVASTGGDVTVAPADQWIWMIRSCLDSLPPPRRSIARRRWHDGLDSEQIASELGRDPIEINDELGRVGRRLNSQLGLPGSVLSELLVDPATWVEVVDEGSSARVDEPGSTNHGSTERGDHEEIAARDDIAAQDDIAPGEDVDARDDIAAQEPRPMRSPGRFGRLGLLAGGALLAVIVLFVLLVALSAGDELERSEVASVDLTPTGLVDGVDGSLTISTSDVGAIYELDVSPLPELPDDGSAYRVVLVIDDGSIESVASFLQGGSIDAVSATPLGSVNELRIIESDRDARSSADFADARALLRADVAAAMAP